MQMHVGQFLIFQIFQSSGMFVAVNEDADWTSNIDETTYGMPSPQSPL